MPKNLLHPGALRPLSGTLCPNPLPEGYGRSRPGRMNDPGVVVMLKPAAALKDKRIPPALGVVADTAEWSDRRSLRNPPAHPF